MFNAYCSNAYCSIDDILPGQQFTYRDKTYIMPQKSDVCGDFHPICITNGQSFPIDQESEEWFDVEVYALRILD